MIPGGPPSIDTKCSRARCSGPSSSFPAEARFVPNVRHAMAPNTTRNLSEERDWMCMVSLFVDILDTAATSGRNPLFRSMRCSGRVYVQRPVRNTVKVDRDCRLQCSVRVRLEEMSLIFDSLELAEG